MTPDMHEATIRVVAGMGVPYVTMEEYDTHATWFQAVLMNRYGMNPDAQMHVDEPYWRTIIEDYIRQDDQVRATQLTSFIMDAEEGSLPLLQTEVRLSSRDRHVLDALVKKFCRHAPRATVERY